MPTISQSFTPSVGKDFEIRAFARAYPHSCWKFQKSVGFLPAKSTFKYND
jgi:hypothetical protein